MIVLTISLKWTKTLIPEESKIVNNFKLNSTKMILWENARISSYKIIQTETKSFK